MNTLLLWFSCESHSLSAFIRQAVEMAFPTYELIELKQLSEAQQRPPTEKFLLILMEPHERDIAHALRVTEAADIVPRPVVAVSSDHAPLVGVEIIRPDFSLLWAAHVLRQAMTVYELQRENARLRGDMLTVGTRLSHDLRTPLGGINITADLLKEVLTDEKPELVELLSPIWESSEEMSSMIREISLLAKANGQTISPSLVNMGDGIMAACQRLEHRILQRAGAVIQPMHWPHVLGVPAWLESIWWHLLSNALKHGKPSSKIELGWEQFGKHYNFWLQNEGEAISSTKQAKLFQPFDQLHKSNARKGLGLSIVERLVELQGGSCTYQTGSNGGPRFIFTLPVPA
jgi:signal transduction histidine kinase